MKKPTKTEECEIRIEYYKTIQGSRNCQNGMIINACRYNEFFITVNNFNI